MLMLPQVLMVDASDHLQFGDRGGPHAVAASIAMMLTAPQLVFAGDASAVSRIAPSVYLLSLSPRFPVAVRLL